MESRGVGESSSSTAISNSLRESIERAGTTGRGVELLRERDRGERERSKSPRRDKEHEAYYAFIAQRLPIDKRLNKNQKKQAAGKNLRYDNCDASTKAGLVASRRAEWEKWLHFNAGHVVRGELLKELLDEGHRLIPTQWIETDRNEHKRRPGVFVPPDFKSRLVGCGQLENALGLRTDSPTAELEAINMIASFAACNCLRLKTADISNAYFQGKPLDILLLLKPHRVGFREKVTSRTRQF